MSEKSAKKTWKEHLLSSGVPLEYSVIQIFNELGISDAEEYRYQRKTADGVMQIFSVDVHSTKIDSKREFWIECLVECKYRHDGTNWVFMPCDYDDLIGPSFSELFVCLDEACSDRKLDHSILGKFEDQYPLCAKGIELLPDDANPKSLEQAMQQLRYAVVSKVIDAISYQKGIPDPKRIPIFVIVPIIVTTAPLWRLKVGTTIKEVRDAKEISEVADPHDVLVILQKPDELHQRDTRALFRDRLEEQGLLEDRKLEQFIFYHSSFTPSMFIVITYKRLKSALKNLHTFFANDRLIKNRTAKDETSTNRS